MLNRTRSTGLIALAASAALVLAGCGGSDDALDTGSDDGGGDSSTIVVGSANFPENELLMQIYAQALEATGVTVETKPNIGAREVYLEAFNAGDIDLLPEYNGALLAYLSPDGVADDISSPEQVYDALQAVLPEGSETLTQSDAEDKDTLTVTQETADQYSLASIADLAPVAGDLTIGAGPEFKDRFQGIVGLTDTYGVTFKEFKALDAGGPLVKTALTDGDIQVANVFSTDPAIVENDWVVLDDPDNLFLAQNIVPLITSDVVTDDVTAALDAVSAALTTEELTNLLKRVQDDKDDPSVVAKDFLADNDLG